MSDSKLLLTVGLTLVSTLIASAEPTRGRLPNGDNAAAVFAFTIDQPRQVDLQMKSTDFDSYLSLLLVGEGEGEERYTLVATDDDGGQDLNSRIQQELAPGEYRLVAQSLDGGGAFTVTANSYKPAPALLIDSVVGDLAAGRPAPAAGDPGVEAFGPRAAVPTTIRVIKEGRLQIDVLALGQMDALLMLSGPDGQILDVNDDELTVQHSRIIQSVTPGNYTAWVTMSDENAPHVGEYLLNATFRLVEGEAELELEESPADKDDVIKLILDPGAQQGEGLVGALLGAAVGVGEQAGGAIWTGREVPDFELQEVGAERRVSLEDLRGRLVLLDFWEPWCGPCLQTMPHLERLQKELEESHKLTVVGIAASDVGQLQAATEQLETSYLQLHDPGDTVSEAYGVESIPRLLIIGPDGVALADVTGAKSYEDLLTLIETVTEDAAE